MIRPNTTSPATLPVPPRHIVPVMCLVFALVLSGCAVHSATGGADPQRILGEHVAYRVVNQSERWHRAEMPELVDPAHGRLLYRSLVAPSEHHVADQNARRRQTAARPLPAVLVGRADAGGAALKPAYFRQDPGDENLHLPINLVVVHAVAPRGHRVPDSVQLSWRAPPHAGQALFGGTAVPSQRIDIRNQVPAAVLAKVRDQWRYRLNIDVAITDGAPRVNWRLVDRSREGMLSLARSRSSAGQRLPAD